MCTNKQCKMPRSNDLGSAIWRSQRSSGSVKLPFTTTFGFHHPSRIWSGLTGLFSVNNLSVVQPTMSFQCSRNKLRVMSDIRFGELSRAVWLGAALTTHYWLTERHIPSSRLASIAKL
ncbi:hypothetical protein HD806DRAFT_296263 [Xylariaceae sp. AK1471]|nr:hypothetical protein HD806DRAFT_296263 [Xylariaceae sp. AK1471]